MKHGFVVGLLFFAASTAPVFAQGPTFDTSGNKLLNGTYYFRHVLYGIDANGQATGSAGGISDAAAVFGNIVFNGGGAYSIANGTASDYGVDTQSGQIVQAPLSCFITYNAGGNLCTSGGTTVSGSYAISASGFGFLTNPVTGDKIFGLLSANGVFVGSSTETSGYNDLFIAAPANPALTNASFQAPNGYSVVGFFPGGGAAGVLNGSFGNPGISLGASFQLNPNGAGSLGPVSITGTAGTGATLTQSTNNVTYSFSNGAAVINFPANSQNGYFFPGGTSAPEYLYFSPDGNFFFGGSPTIGFDMIVGVRNTSGALNFGGIYYQAGLDEDVSTLSAGFANFDNYYGSLNATGTGDVLIHQRLNDFENGTYGWTSADSFTPPIQASYTDTPAAVQYAVGAGGAIRIGQGLWPYMGLTINLQAPTFAPAGSVFLKPTGIVNAATFSPFTAGVSNGEMVTLFGNNLAPGALAATTLPLPTTQGLDGVTVLVNGAYAPINYVSPTQILINVPFAASLACPQTNGLLGSSCFAQFQVINNGTASNPVTVVLNATTPGIFTSDYGLGYGYVQHSADYSLVTPSNPAQPGETVIAYVSGLGNVNPTVADGAAAPGGVQTSSTVGAYIDGLTASVSFAGLVPTLAGLYQVNLAIPTSGLTAGDNTIDIGGPDSYSSQALISIGSGAAAADRKPAARARPHPGSHANITRKRVCLRGPRETCKSQ